MKRRQAREAALQALFQVEVGRVAPDKAIAYVVENNELVPEVEEFCRSLVEGVLREKDKLDQVIAELAVDWSLERLGNVDRNVLRLGLYEIMFRDDIPTSVSINEAVEIAKRYGDSKSGRFINGILGQFVRTQTQSSDKAAGIDQSAGMPAGMNRLPGK